MAPRAQRDVVLTYEILGGNPMGMTVAFLGNSAMWGTGLAEEHQYARLAVEGLLGDRSRSFTLLKGLGLEPGRGFPRTGAKINAAIDDGPDVAVLLPSGATLMAKPGDRARFVLTYRSKFESDEAVLAFLAGPAGERPTARAIFGDVPATFPTITGQLEFIADSEGPSVDLAIIDGGINDVEFEEVINPIGLPQNTVDESIDRAFGPALSDLLIAARKKMPNAVIIVAGYYAAISTESDREALKLFFYFYTRTPAWKAAFNEFEQGTWMKGILEGIGLSTDVNALVELAISRTVTASARAHHRALAAIAALPKSIRDPGIGFAHPAFLPRNAVWASEAFVHSRYRFPGHGYVSVNDEMHEIRSRRIPWVKLLGTYHQLHKKIEDLEGIRATNEQEENYSEGNPPDYEGEKRAVADLRKAVAGLVEQNPDLPTPILLFPNGGDVAAPDRTAQLKKLVDGEVARIETATIASFLHPNRAGARRYADRIVLTYQRMQKYSLKAEIPRMTPSLSPNASVRAAFDMHGADLNRHVRTLAAVTFVECVAIDLIGLSRRHHFVDDLSSPLPIVASAQMVTGDTRIDLGRLPIPILLPRSLTFAFDAWDRVHLGDITQFAITTQPALQFAILVVHINGIEYLRRRWNDGVVAQRQGMQGDIVIEFDVGQATGRRSLARWLLGSWTSLSARVRSLRRRR
jgi:hypothetical protein